MHTQPSWKRRRCKMRFDKCCSQEAPHSDFMTLGTWSIRVFFKVHIWISSTPLPWHVGQTVWEEGVSVSVSCSCWQWVGGVYVNTKLSFYPRALKPSTVWSRIRVAAVSDCIITRANLTPVQPWVIREDIVLTLCDSAQSTGTIWCNSSSKTRLITFSTYSKDLVPHLFHIHAVLPSTVWFGVPIQSA